MARTRAVLIALVAAAAALSCTATTALASTYQNMGNHYSFVYPSNWSQEGSANADAAFLGPADGGFRPNMLSQHESEPTARNASSWILSYATNSFNLVKGQYTVTEIQAPRAFETAGGRVAADYVFERVVGNLTVRQRQVFFVSEFFKQAYFLTFTDKQASYALQTAFWTEAVDSFAVQGEPAGSAFSGMLPLLAVVAVAGVVLVSAGVLMKRRNTRAAFAAPPPPPTPPGAFPPLPPPPPPPPPR